MQFLHTQQKVPTPPAQKNPGWPHSSPPPVLNSPLRTGGAAPLLQDALRPPRERTARLPHKGKKSSEIKYKRFSAFVERRAITRLLDARKNHTDGKKPSGYSAIGCGVWAMYGTGPEAPHNSDKTRAFIGARFKCNTRHCPACSARKAADYRGYVKFAAQAAESQGLTGDLLTFTLAHTMQGNWRDTVKCLGAAYTHMHKRIARQLKTLGVSHMKSLESPVGINGIHPHFHALAFRPSDWSVEQEQQFSAIVSDQWAKSLLACGGSCNEHGFDYKPNCVNDYLAKDATAHEVAAHNTKSAKTKGRTFVQLLHDYIRGDAKSGEYFLKWSEAMRGMKRFDTRALSRSLGIISFEQWLEQEQPKGEPMQQAFDATPDDEKITLNVDQSIVNTLAASPVRDYYPFVLDYGKRLCRDITAENKPAKLKQWQHIFNRCLAEHKKFMAMRPHLNMNAEQIQKAMSAASCRPLTPDEIPQYNTARIFYHRKPAQLQKLRRLYQYQKEMK